MRFSRFPEHFIINGIVTMSQHIAHAYDLLPFDLSVFSAEVRRQTISGFTDDFDYAFQSEAEYSIML